MKSFEGSLDKITKIQTSFFKEAEDFVYFRKGEFANIIEILNFVKDYITNNPETILVALAAYPGAKEIAKDTFRFLKKKLNKIKYFIGDNNLSKLYNFYLYNFENYIL